MDDIEDTWPMPAYQTARKEYLHAFGVVVFNFNNFEFILFSPFFSSLRANGNGN